MGRRAHAEPSRGIEESLSAASDQKHERGAASSRADDKKGATSTTSTPGLLSFKEKGGASPASAAHGIADEIWAVLRSIDGNRRRTYDAIRAAQAQLFAHTEEYFLRVGEALTRG